MEESKSFNYYTPDANSPRQTNGDFSFDANTDRRFAYSRNSSFQYPQEPHTPVSIKSNDYLMKPILTRNMSSIDMPPGDCNYFLQDDYEEEKVSEKKISVLDLFSLISDVVKTGNKYMKKLLILILLNVAYSTLELAIGLLTGRVGGNSLTLFPLISIYSSVRFLNGYVKKLGSTLLI